MLGLGNTLGRQSTPLSSAPVGFDKTWNFDSDTEGFYGQTPTGVVEYVASHTPSSDSERSGLLSVYQGSSNDATKLAVLFDLSTEPLFDNSQPIYYSVTYSVDSSLGLTGLNSVYYGAGGSNDNYFNYNVVDVWDTVTGELALAGFNNIFFIQFDPSNEPAGARAYIDTIRLSHTDFR